MFAGDKQCNFFQTFVNYICKSFENFIRGSKMIKKFEISVHALFALLAGLRIIIFKKCKKICGLVDFDEKRKKIHKIS
jgi:hypothetical protein